jgi:hypothetical protein
MTPTGCYTGTKRYFDSLFFAAVAVLLTWSAIYAFHRFLGENMEKQLPERMRLLADMMLDGFAWFDLPWSEEFITAIYDRLALKIEIVPLQVREEAFIQKYENLTAASVTKKWLGAADLLKECLNYKDSPEGENFWEAVEAAFREIESLYEGEDCGQG